MTKQDIIDLLVEGDAASVDTAIKAMRLAAPKDNITLNLASQWNTLKKKYNQNLADRDDAITRNRILHNLLEMAGNLPDNTVVDLPIPPKTEPAPPKANAGPVVFLSYNHKDKEVATKVKNYLEGQKIKVTIDSEAMRAGEDIAEFINKCIRESDVTLSLVSTYSLLSAWVGIETMSTLVGEKIAGKKFMSIVIDGAFYDRKFVDTAFTTVEERLAELKQLIMERLEKDRGIEDLQSERTRNKNLMNDLPEIVANLRARLNVDIFGDNFEAGMAKIAKDILA
jgi:hypothetical protein